MAEGGGIVSVAPSSEALANFELSGGAGDQGQSGMLGSKATPAVAAWADSCSRSGIAVGDVVNVVPRTGPNINKQGGVARVRKVNEGDGTVDVAWVMGGRDFGIPLRYVRAYSVGENVVDAATSDPASQQSGGRSSRRNRQSVPPKDLEDTAPKAGAQASNMALQARARIKKLSRFVERQIKDADRLMEKLCKEDYEAYFAEEVIPGGAAGAPLSIELLQEKNLRGDFADESSELLQWADLGAQLRDIFVAAVEKTENSDEVGSLGRESRRLLVMASSGIEALAARYTAEAPLEAYRSRLRALVEENDEAYFQGEIRDEAYPLRVYKRYLEDYVPAEELPAWAKEEVARELDTDLKDGYLGEAYSYDDHGISEQWMVELGATAGDVEDDSPQVLDGETINSQVVTRLESMVQQVVDRINNEKGTLLKDPKTVGRELKEIPAWGIDCHTRKNVEIALRLGAEEYETPGACATSALRNWDEKQRTRWIEKCLLPAINICSSSDMMAALQHIMARDLPVTSPCDREAASLVLRARETIGHKGFRCHPKGTGIVYNSPEGIPAHTFVNKYLGEIYPSWRWTQKLEAVEATQRQCGLKPGLPDFYNILLERPRVCPRGYNLLFVEAGGHVANLGSTLSHSCDSNCTTAVVVKDGRLCIALTTTRDVQAGEELTIDYNSVTTSLEEYKAAVCLCGSVHCRGSFLHFSGAKAFPLILERISSVLFFRNLLRATTPHPLSNDEKEVLRLHGFGDSVLGRDCPLWLLKYAASLLQYVEFERRKLPLELMKMPPDKLSGYSYNRSSADSEARAVMEQRVQSLVTVLGTVRYVLAANKDLPTDSSQATAAAPLKLLSDEDAIYRIWKARNSLAKRLVERVESTFAAPVAKQKQQTGTDTNACEDDTSTSEETSITSEEPSSSVSALSPSSSSKAQATSLGVSSAELSQLEANLDKDALVQLWDPTAQKKVPAYGGVKCRNLRKYLKKKPWLVLLPQINTAKQSQNDTESKAKGRALVAEMKDLIRNTEVVHRGQLKEALISLRSLVRRIPGGLGAAAADVLLLLAHTRNLVLPESYPEVTADPIKVRARDLGVRISTSVRKKLEHKDEAASAGGSKQGADDSAAIIPPTAKGASKPKQSWLKGDEVVSEIAKVYPQHFVLAQLLDWHNDGSGTDVEKSLGVSITGCSRLPAPADCFPSPDYDAKSRKMLIQSLEDPRKRWKPWEGPLMTAMGLTNGTNRNKQPPILGSPTIDKAMGDEVGLCNVLSTLGAEFSTESSLSDSGSKRKASSKSKSGCKRSRLADMDDDVPEGASAPPCSWVQCEEPSCLKWRRVPWFVDVEKQLGSAPFVCSANKWAPEEASCSAPEAEWDPDEEAQNVTWGEGDHAMLHKLPVVGMWIDAYDCGTSEWLPAKVLKVDDTRGARVHYYRWSSKWDEWVALDSQRLAALHSRTRKVKETPSWLFSNQILEQKKPSSSPTDHHGSKRARVE